MASKNTLLSLALITAFSFSLALDANAQAQAARARSARPSSSAVAVSSDLKQAQQALARGQFGEAEEAVKRELKRSPDSIAALNLLGLIYDQEGKHDEAVSTLKQALSLDPRSTDTLNNLGNSYAARNESELAEKAFREALKLQPTDKAANYNLALLLADGRPKEALQHLLKIASPDAATRLLIIRAYFESGMTAEGQKAAEALSRDSQSDARVHFSLGMLLGSHRQYQAAVHELELANAQRPRTLEIMQNLGQAYLMAARPSSAERVLRAALELQADNSRTPYLLAQALSDQQKDVDALELLVRARKLAPQDSNIVFLMARLSMKQSLFEDAIELLTQGVKLDPRRADLHAALGESYFTVGQADKALEEFKTMLALDPSPRSYAFMGLYYRNLDQYDQAKQYFAKALELDPKNLPSLYSLGLIAKRQHNEAQAESYLLHALQLDPNYSDALYELGSLKVDQKKYLEAIPLLKRCTETSAKPEKAYYKLALAERDAHMLEASKRDMNVFQTLSKNPKPGPYPLQHLFDNLERRSSQSEQQRNVADLQQLESEAKENPDRPRTLLLLANAYLKLNRTKDAMEPIQHLEQVSGGDFRTSLSIGLLLGRYRLYSEAIPYLEAALRANPESDEAKYNVSEAYFRTNRLDDALSVLLTISNLGQKDGAYCALMGDVYARLGRAGDALKYMQQALAIRPDDERSYTSLALEQLQIGKTDQAKSTVLAGLNRIPDSATLYWIRALVSVIGGNAQEGVAHLKKSQELDPSRQIAFTSLGVLYYEMARYDEAREALRRCEEMFPNSSIDFQKIQHVLDAAPRSQTASAGPGRLSPEAGREFVSLSLSMAEQAN